MIKKGFIMIVFLLLISGCGNTSYEPKEVNPEVDVCEVCNMSIVHTDHVTQIIEEDGTSHFYDDIGCMEQFLAGDGNNIKVAEKYVTDFESEKWVKYSDAHYVYDKEISTPMMFGVVSFSSKEKAEQFIKREDKGKLLTTEELKTIDWGN